MEDDLPYWQASTPRGKHVYWVFAGKQQSDVEFVWKESYDAKRKRPYYSNIGTGAKAWKLPLGTEPPGEKRKKKPETGTAAAANDERKVVDAFEADNLLHYEGGLSPVVRQPIVTSVTRNFSSWNSLMLSPEPNAYFPPTPSTAARCNSATGSPVGHVAGTPLTIPRAGDDEKTPSPLKVDRARPRRQPKPPLPAHEAAQTLLLGTGSPGGLSARESLLLAPAARGKAGGRRTRNGSSVNNNNNTNSNGGGKVKRRKKRSFAHFGGGEWQRAGDDEMPPPWDRDRGSPEGGSAEVPCVAAGGGVGAERLPGGGEGAAALLKEPECQPFRWTARDEDILNQLASSTDSCSVSLGSCSPGNKDGASPPTRLHASHALPPHSGRSSSHWKLSKRRREAPAGCSPLRPPGFGAVAGHGQHTPRTLAAQFLDLSLSCTRSPHRVTSVCRSATSEMEEAAFLASLEEEAEAEAGGHCVNEDTVRIVEPSGDEEAEEALFLEMLSSGSPTSLKTDAGSAKHATPNWTRHPTYDREPSSSGSPRVCIVRAPHRSVKDTIQLFQTPESQRRVSVD
ncbi:hypothetical protein DIPPA_00330 [Diplonema papillatum]|nr:hypothetical protein DIPPA_00330 [Diplonema papillatum]